MKTTYVCQECGQTLAVEFAAGEPRPITHNCPFCKNGNMIRRISVSPNNDDDIKRVSIAVDAMKYGGMVSKGKVIL
jgi:transposase-like protein